MALTGGAGRRLQGPAPGCGGMTESYMEPRRGYYSLIQYCPDFARAESVNVGVILLAPEHHFLAAKTTGTNRRARILFGHEHVDAKRLDFAKASIEKRLKTDREHLSRIDNFRDYAARQANELVITPPRFIKVTEPAKQLMELFEEFVRGPLLPNWPNETSYPQRSDHE